MIPILTTFLISCPYPKQLNWRYTFPRLFKIVFSQALCWPAKRGFLPRLLRRCSVAAAFECRSLHSAVYNFTACGMRWEIPLKKTLFEKKPFFWHYFILRFCVLVKLIARLSLIHPRFSLSVCTSITLSVCFWMIACLVFEWLLVLFFEWLLVLFWYFVYSSLSCDIFK